MRAPEFWYSPRGVKSTVLAPLSWIYRAGASTRRALATPYQAKVPVICIGNIVAGGSGKTPTAIAVARLLKDRGHKPAFVTRGYGGKERGPLLVDLEKHTARDVGDEALLLAREAPVWIGRNRPRAIREAEKKATHIVLDDGLQNPTIKPDLSFLVVDADMGLGNERLIPAGPLRETYANVMKRVSAIILIDGHKNDRHSWMKDVNCPVLQARYEAVLPENFPPAQKFFAFAGIGYPRKFYATCHEIGLTLVGTQDFADHHVFTANDLRDLRRRSKDHAAHLLTTEKDWIRLPPGIRRQILNLPVVLAFDDPTALKKLLKTRAVKKRK